MARPSLRRGRLWPCRCAARDTPAADWWWPTMTRCCLPWATTATRTKTGASTVRMCGRTSPKIMRITPSDGAVSVAALGCARRAAAGDRHVGGRALAHVRRPGRMGRRGSERRARWPSSSSRRRSNFGWGRHPVDGKSREGSFEIDRPGQLGKRGPATTSRASCSRSRSSGARRTSRSPFPARCRAVRFVLAHHAAVRRPGQRPASSRPQAPMTERRQAVFEVARRGRRGQGHQLKALAGNAGPIRRFFTFPDGTAGVLLEKTGEFFRVTEIR